VTLSVGKTAVVHVFVMVILYENNVSHHVILKLV